MARTKAKKYLANSNDFRVVERQYADFDTLRGHRKDTFFQNNNPIVLELACGYGEYSVGLGRIYPDRNFLGIDIKGDRIAVGARHAQETSSNNIGFIRTIIHHLDQVFVPGEVDEIWLIHPDPRPKSRDQKRRLTYKRFLDIYQRIAHPNAVFHLKTDDHDFFSYSLEHIKQFGWTCLASTIDLYNTPDLLALHHGITTKYEKHFTAQGRTICYAQRRM